MIQGGTKSGPGNMTQRRGFLWGRSQNRSHSTKTGARAVASNDPKSEEISSKPLPRLALRGGVNSGGDTALSSTFFAPSVHPPIWASNGQAECLRPRYTAPHTALCGARVLYPAHTTISAHSGSQAVTCWPGPLSSADALQISPTAPAVGRSVHLSPPGSDGACTAGSHCVSDQPWW